MFLLNSDKGSFQRNMYNVAWQSQTRFFSLTKFSCNDSAVLSCFAEIVVLAGLNESNLYPEQRLHSDRHQWDN